MNSVFLGGELDNEKKKVAEDLREEVNRAAELAEKLGLDPYPVRYWVLDHDEVNRAVAYDGFQKRYPHWRWGMKYDRMKKAGQFSSTKVYELVVNDNPSHAFLQVSNDEAEQKAVICHVEAHSDFFKNNRWFRELTENIDAARFLSGNAEKIRGYMDDPEISREEVERWIDNVLCLQDNIDPHTKNDGETIDSRGKKEEVTEMLESMEISEEVKSEIFKDEWIEEQKSDDTDIKELDRPIKDILGFLLLHGRQYDEETGKSTEYMEWQRGVIDALRREAYYFAPQKMTKVMNEGWAAYWESVMMGEEAFAERDEFLMYSEHQAKILGSGGSNPYKLGKSLWEYIENKENRESLVKELLRVKGITPGNFVDEIDMDMIRNAIQPDPLIDSVSLETLDELRDRESEKIDHDALNRALNGEIDIERYPWMVLNKAGLAERHYSLNKPQNQGFLESISKAELEGINRYLMEDELYSSVEEALDEMDYLAGWSRMFEVRETHNDVTFIDEFLNQEFVDRNNYFAYEYSESTGNFHVSSTDYIDVKKKLLLQFTNFGKPTIKIHDANYENKGELLLCHHYNGVKLDVDKAKETLKRIHGLWGRPVNLRTITKKIDDNVKKMAKRRGKEPRYVEKGLHIRYDGENFDVEEMDKDKFSDITADDIDYDTKPDDWL